MHGPPQRLAIVPERVPHLRECESGPIRLSLDDVPERKRLPILREFFGRSVLRYDIEPLPDVPVEFDIWLRALPGLKLMWGKGHGTRNQRTREMIAAEGSDDIGLVVNVRGPQRVTCGQRDLVLDDGEAILVSLAEVYSFTHRPPGDILAFRVPRAQLAPRVANMDDCHCRRIPKTTPALKLLVDYFRIAQPAITGVELQHLVVDHIYDLMAVAIGGTRDAAEPAQDGGLRAARLHVIRKDIAENLDQADLSVATVAARHGCTPRFIQRLFEAEGVTFTEYVLTQRLARARRMLTDPCRAGDKISTIALDAGFNDVSYFNRSFRQRYGETPSGVRGLSARHA